MLPEVLDAPQIWRGDGWSWPVEFYADDKFTVPVDLTGYGTSWAGTARAPGMMVAIAVDASAAATGRLVLSLTHTVTATLLPSLFEYSVQATSVSGEPVTLFCGVVPVDGPEV